MGYFYKDKPLIGLDVGTSTLKVMQIVPGKKENTVQGYGFTKFDPTAVVDGEIMNYEELGEAARRLFAEEIIGKITADRVAFAIPASRTYSRTMSLPKMSKKEIYDAVTVEAEQYIPVPINDLYIDYNIIEQKPDGIDLLAVAVPKRIVDSYRLFARLLGLDLAVIETTIGAATRLFVESERSDVPTMLIDFGSESSDITIHDKAPIVTGTSQGGGDNFTRLIMDGLGVTHREAHIIKTKYGLSYSKKQDQIKKAVEPILQQLLKEVRRMMRYYEERSEADQKIEQLVTMGGGANMPGLSEFMTDSLRLPVRMCAPWQRLNFGKLQPPNQVEKSMYITVAGLASIKPGDIYSS